MISQTTRSAVKIRCCQGNDNRAIPRVGYSSSKATPLPLHDDRPPENNAYPSPLTIHYTRLIRNRISSPCRKEISIPPKALYVAHGYSRIGIAVHPFFSSHEDTVGRYIPVL